jgi:DeoR/GlpR family transcriptional regulator of sugar metabolism
MKPQERRGKILEILRLLKREMKVEDVAKIFGVSPLTVRRDLDVLAEDKAIVRTHGGCLSIGRAALETEYHQKVAKNYWVKRSIALAARRYLVKNDVILLNDGSTTFHVGVQAGDFGGCTIYTNSLAMIAEFTQFNDVRLFLLAGEYDEEHYSIRGSLTEQMLDNLRFDKVFLGTDSIDEEGRCLVATPEEARLAHMMLHAGRFCILVADHTKVGASGHIAFGRLEDFDVWVTSGEISEEARQRYQEKTDLVVAPATEEF